MEAGPRNMRKCMLLKYERAVERHRIKKSVFEFPRITREIMDYDDKRLDHSYYQSGFTKELDTQKI